MDDFLSSAKAGKKRQGKKQLVAYLEGKVLTRQAAIKAKCYDCDGMGDTGECDLRHCALFPYSPYGGKRDRRGGLSHPSQTKTIPHTHAGGAMGTKESI